MTALTLERGHARLVEVMDAPIASYFSSCVHCGLCADACLFYTETGDPKYTPIHKLEPLRRVWKQEYTFWGKLAASFGLSKPLRDAELTQWEELVYDSCTMCGRCSMVCPVGNDIVYMIRKLREGMVASGHAPKELLDATVRTITIGSSMGVRLPALQKQIAMAEKESGIKIHMDKQGAEYMLLLSSAEIMQFPEFIAAVAKVFDHVGASWTISSEAFEATNSGLHIGSSDLAAELVERVVHAAEKLQIATVISPECGHAYTALRWEGPNLIGRPYPFKLQHILEILDQWRAEGRLHTKGMEQQRLTFHDPCQLVRRGGVVEAPRNLLKMVANDFVEMEEPGVWNWCCGGGGGVSSIERAEPLRIKVFSRKKKQLDAIGVKTMVTACSNCRNMLEEGLEHNDMTVSVVGLTEVLVEYLVDKDSASTKEDSAL